MREGRTLTRTMQFEPRQHELLGLDLGDGPPRRALIFGIVLTAAWWVLMFAVFRAPQKGTFLLWVLPPGLLGVYGWRESAVTDRRRKVTEWALALRWLRRGHRPIIALGRHEPSAAEQMRVADRIGHRLGHDDPLAVFMPWRLDPSSNHASQDAGKQARSRSGQAVTLNQEVQLFGTETARQGVEDLLARRSPRAARGKGK